jgi:hypothetical protein
MRLLVTLIIPAAPAAAPAAAAAAAAAALPCRQYDLHLLDAQEQAVLASMQVRWGVELTATQR